MQLGGAVRGCSCLRSALPLAKARTAPINIIVHSTLLEQLRQLHPLSKCSNVLVCKVIKKVSYMQSLFVVISRLFSPFASAVQSDSVRRPIGFRTPSDQIPSAAQSDSVRRPIRFRPTSDRIPYAARRTTTPTYRPKAFHIAPKKPPQLNNCHILLRKCYIHLADRIILLKFVSCETNAMK